MQAKEVNSLIKPPSYLQSIKDEREDKEYERLLKKLISRIEAANIKDPQTPPLPRVLAPS